MSPSKAWGDSGKTKDVLMIELTLEQIRAIKAIGAILRENKCTDYSGNQLGMFRVWDANGDVQVFTPIALDMRMIELSDDT